MAVQNSMFLFEVVVQSFQSFVESRALVIKGDFSNIFSLELKDPKQMNIKIPEPPPPPPEPPGKKGKKKPKPKKPKKGKKGKVEEPPPEPEIYAGQSVLFTSNPEFLTQEMNINPLVLSVWSKEENLAFIGSTRIGWDPVFLLYLEKLYKCETAPPPVVKDFYNIFEEGTAKIIAKVAIQVKLSHLTDRIISSFRSLSEDSTQKRFLYTGMNSKLTSYISTLKTTDEEYEEKLKEIKKTQKLQHGYVKDPGPPVVLPGQPPPKQIFASYKNAPGAKLPIFKDGDYCCMGHADKSPDEKYKAAETCPDIDFICDYVRKIITSCNDNMRMLTPRPTIRPRIKATDLDRLCYCRETSWPQSKLAERFRKEVQSAPCPICVRDDNDRAHFGEVVPKVIDIANIRGPCGKHDCRIARDMRAYIADLVEEDNKEFNISEIVGPCGSKSCTLVDRIKDFLTHKGPFAHGPITAEGLSTQCTCVNQMQNALMKKKSCDSECNVDCKDSEDSSTCGGKICPYKKKSDNAGKVYDVYYFTVEYDHDKDPGGSSPGSKSPTEKVESQSSTRKVESKGSTYQTDTTVSSTKYKYCSTRCPSLAANETSCSKAVCGQSPMLRRSQSEKKIKCLESECPDKGPYTPSPADSNIIIPMEEIRNPCCVKTCPVADEVRTFISLGLAKKSKSRPCLDEDDPCYCDCTCNFKFSAKTTYCPVCGGYECLGDDMRDEPEFAKPHPCPVYHKLYDRNVIKTKSPWPEEENPPPAPEAPPSGKSGRAMSLRPDSKNLPEKRPESAEQDSSAKSKKKKKVGKFTTNQMRMPGESPEPKPKKLLFKPIEHVPKNMGWLWTSEDIPGMKPRPKWRPGAANKILVRRYRTMREGVDIIAKKKRALLNRKKKIEMKPTLVVKKTDGEYTVQMEVFKKYSKDRLKYQYPYDEKPPLIYTVGKTEETKRKIQRQRDRRERRETRRKSKLLQSTFRDKCQEICLKAYNQAIGLVPLPNPNNPACACDIPIIEAPSPIIDSCSCSDTGTISSSDTDGDDWIIEFTPPLARWDPKAKHPPVVLDNESQYTYLDFKVKIFDKQGNPIPRFFKGPNGEQVCSDLGGFWGPNNVWQEINKDGYIGPDNRWVPLNFYGPDGVMYSSEDGFFVDATGLTYRIGVDGYIDKEGKWAWYSKKRSEKSLKTASTTTVKGGHGRGGKGDSAGGKAAGGGAAATGGAPGAASHTKDNTHHSKGAPAAAAAAPHTGKGASSPGKISVASAKGNNKKVVIEGIGGAGNSHTGAKARGPVIAAMTYNDPFPPEMMRLCDKRQMEYIKNCDKRSAMLTAQMKNARAMEALRAMRLQEIMDELSMYEDLACSYQDLRPQTVSKASRAVNTPQMQPPRSANECGPSPEPLLAAGAKRCTPQRSCCSTRPTCPK